MEIEYADRLNELPPYLFAEIDKAKQEAVGEGRPIIDLGVGDPDSPTPDFIVKKLHEASLDPSTHRYALNKGLRLLREEMAAWYRSASHLASFAVTSLRLSSCMSNFPAKRFGSILTNLNPIAGTVACRLSTAIAKGRGGFFPTCPAARGLTNTPGGATPPASGEAAV